MERLLKFEMLGLFFLSVFLFWQVGMEGMGLPWWWYLALFLLPDIGMLGYVVNTKVGAYTYNATHLFAVAALCIIAGSLYTLPYVELAGIIMLGHSACDRALGYGLKYPDGFKHTHLGWLK